MDLEQTTRSGNYAQIHNRHTLPFFIPFYASSPLCCPVCVRVCLFLWDVRRQHVPHIARLTSLGLEIATGSSNACPCVDPFYRRTVLTLLALTGLFSWDSGDSCFLFSSFHFIPVESNFSPTIMPSSWAVTSQHFGLQKDS